ncbi:peptidylprolyl isomerase [uncultured Fibrobacter sp.]|uniref:FKBP-type peptidyl-prolyl cis-trans isomerase n=1 Tax=uncultured Fibrobacter sp. TaxID=261512 RepID=UPI0025EBF23D|nr:peptidylprolyl isomerase [uncultured Fibrobacter sp.]
MKIADKTVVQMHYTLTSDEGKVIDSSEGREPLQYIQGAHMIVVGLEKAMVGHEVGDKFDVKVIPAEGYGEYDERMTQEVPLDVFQDVQNVEAGMMFYAQTPMGPMPIRVKSVSGDKAVIDANHELAGQNLNFAIEVVDVREATEEELNPQGHCCCGKHEGEGEHECHCGDPSTGSGTGKKENCDGQGGCGCPHHDEHHNA